MTARGALRQLALVAWAAAANFYAAFRRHPALRVLWLAYLAGPFVAVAVGALGGAAPRPLEVPGVVRLMAAALLALLLLRVVWPPRALVPPAFQFLLAQPVPLNVVVAELALGGAAIQLHLALWALALGIWRDFFQVFALFLYLALCWEAWNALLLFIAGRLSAAPRPLRAAAVAAYLAPALWDAAARRDAPPLLWIPVVAPLEAAGPLWPLLLPALAAGGAGGSWRPSG